MNATHHPPVGTPSAQLDPREAASIIDTQRSASRKQLGVRSAPILLTWGAAWIVGYIVLALGTQPDGTLEPGRYRVFLGCLIAAAAFTVFYVARHVRGLRGTSSRSGVVFSAAWGLGMPAGMLLVSRVSEPLASAGSPEAMEALALLSNGVPCLLVGIIILLGSAMWSESRLAWLGGWILVCTIASTIIGLPAAWWIMALAGGGGMVLCAVAEMVSSASSREGQ